MDSHSVPAVFQRCAACLINPRIIQIQRSEGIYETLKDRCLHSVFLATSVVGFSAVKTLNLLKNGFTKTEAKVESTFPPQVSAPELRSILPPATIPLGIQEDHFDATGYYHIWQERSSGSFSGFESVDISTREYREDNGVYANEPVVPSGSVFAGNKEFPLRKIAVNGREIAFETETIDGVSFKFVGYFPVITMAKCENCEYPSDLNGTLTRTKNGKVAESGEVEFYAGGC